MIINIKGSGVELTEALKQYAEEKAEGLNKFFGNIQGIDIDIGMRSHHHQKGKIFYAEMNVSVPNKVIRVEKEADDLYKAIDKVKDHLKIELEKTKEKRRQIRRDHVRENKEYNPE